MAKQKLADVRRTREALLKARDAYVDAVVMAYDLGESPTDIAAAAGVTEGAVRQTVKRSKDG